MYRYKTQFQFDIINEKIVPIYAIKIMIMTSSIMHVTGWLEIRPSIFVYK